MPTLMRIVHFFTIDGHEPAKFIMQPKMRLRYIIPILVAAHRGTVKHQSPEVRLQVPEL